MNVTFSSLRRTLYRLSLSMAVLNVLSSCDVHEMPSISYDAVDYTIDLTYDTEFPFYKEVIFSRADDGSSRSNSSIYEHDIRYTIKVYPAADSHTADEEAIGTFVFTKTTSSDIIDNQVKIKLNEGSWDLYVWTDFVDKASDEDKYYKTSNFGGITYEDFDNYSGNNECRPAFRGMANVKVVHPFRYMEGEELPDYHTVIDNYPPMARYEFVSTDVDVFINRLPSISTTYQSRIDEESRAEESRSLSRADLQEFKVVFRYTAFMPSVYNVFTDKPTDSMTGMTFESSMDIRDDGIVLGFDHVFVNGNEAIVNVSADVYNGAGEKIASTPSLEVPILRKKNTVIKGEFLSSVGSGGVSIVPGFDGEYNLEIQ